MTGSGSGNPTAVRPDPRPRRPDRSAGHRHGRRPAPGGDRIRGCHNALDIAEIVWQLLEEGREIDPADLVYISPCLTEHVNWFW
jgi:hypothetical protein